MDTIRAYVNGRGVEVFRLSQRHDAVRAWDIEAADQVMAGDRSLTDSRGLPLDPSAVLAGGSIIRIVRGAVAGRRRNDRHSFAPPSDFRKPSCTATSMARSDQRRSWSSPGNIM